MGLDCSHEAFHGAYSAFNQLRQQVCKAVGGSFPPHTDAELLRRLGVGDVAEAMRFKWEGDRWFVPDGVTREAWPGLYLFLCHSDCDGTLSPTECLLVADDLDRVLALPRGGALDAPAGQGHIGQQGGYRAVLGQFVKGCRAAHDADEVLEFH